MTTFTHDGSRLSGSLTAAYREEFEDPELTGTQCRLLALVGPVARGYARPLLGDEPTSPGSSSASA